MKAAIITFGNIRTTPYIHPYLAVMKECAVSEYDVIYWNRQNIEETVGCSHCFEYRMTLLDSENKLKKFFYMKKYADYVINILDTHDYDKVIVLNSLLGILLRRYLQKNVKKRFVLDIRDHSYEHIKWYYKRMQQLMRDAEINVISSKGFKAFLPPARTLLAHNISTGPENEKSSEIIPGKTINIVFLGNIRYAAAYKDFLLKIKGEERICFVFWGFGEDEEFLKVYCTENKIDNVKFMGGYKPEQKPEIVAAADILFNAYGTDLHVKYAISNKFYDAVFYRKPLIVNKGTSMAEEAAGFAYEVDDDFSAGHLLNWYDSLDADIVEKSCIKKQKVVMMENAYFGHEMRKIVGGMQ